MNVIQHIHSCLSIHWVAICFYFINQPCALYIEFDTCFYICDVVVVKSFCIAFLSNKEQFAFQLHASWITIKLNCWGTLGRCTGCSYVKSGSFCTFVLRYKADRIYIQEHVCACVYRKREKQSFHVNNYLQVSCSSNKSVVQRERSNCTLSTIPLSVRFVVTWHLRSPLGFPQQSFLYKVRLYEWWRYTV